MFDFELEAAVVKETSQINSYLNKYLGVVVDEKDLFTPVLSDMRTMPAYRLAAVVGPFSLDFRIEMRKRKIEQMHSNPGEGLFPVVTRVQRGVEVHTPMQGVFKAKASFVFPSSLVSI